MRGIPRFSDEWIESVKSSFDIVEVIGRRVELKQAGQNYVGLCPFHNEKTPSFSVNPERQFYHCFGCQSGGNVINFVMETEHLSFPEAVSKLAQDKGIPIPSVSSQEQQKEEKREQLRKINELAARFYYRNLRSPVGAEARGYLEGRGITEGLARDFYLGYATDDWDGLVRFFEAEGVDLQNAQEAGLVSQGTRGLIDRFRGRLMFPICDHLGRFLGFGGRSMKTGQPKYLNTGQTEIFNKGLLLYGLNWAKDEIKTQDQVVIVEGYTDLISLSAVGIKNVVAPLGTAFTSAHGKLLKRFCSQAVIAFDGDGAGQKAALRSMGILHESGLTVRIATLESDQDPDTFARLYGSEKVRQWLHSAKPFREYQIDRIISQHDVETREGKLAASTELVSILAQVSNSIERDEYIRYSAQALDVLEQSLASDVRSKLGIGELKPIQSKVAPGRRPVLKASVTVGDDLIEREIIRCILQNPQRLLELQQAGISEHDFHYLDYQRLFISLNQNRSDPEVTDIASVLLALPELTGRWVDYFQSFILILRRRSLQKIEEKLSLLENDRKGFDIRMELYHLLKEYYEIFSTKS